MSEKKTNVQQERYAAEALNEEIKYEKLEGEFKRRRTIYRTFLPLSVVCLGILANNIFFEDKVPISNGCMIPFSLVFSVITVSNYIEKKKVKTLMTYQREKLNYTRDNLDLEGLKKLELLREEKK
ncbi:MAG: hypothetical protein PHC42_01360 [Bacilli bacterium]|nr:hypothetical protein [Bacilli bacterium]